MIQINKCKEYLFQSLFIGIKDVNTIRYYATIEKQTDGKTVNQFENVATEI